jgi:hypothetical protein
MFVERGRLLLAVSVLEHWPHILRSYSIWSLIKSWQ